MPDTDNGYSGDFWTRFHPNILYSIRGPSEFEFQFVPVVFGALEKHFPELKSRIRRTGPGAARFVYHSTALLQNETWTTEQVSLVHLDLEFLRLSREVSRQVTALYNNEPSPGSYELLADRLLFHAGLCTRCYDLLPSLPVGAELAPLDLEQAEWSLYHACFVGAHEARHLELHAGTDDSQSFRRHLAGFVDKVAPLALLLPLQNDYAHLLATLLLGAKGRPYVYAGSDVLSVTDREQDEMNCDIAALGVTVTKLASALSPEGRNRVFDAIVALSGVQCCLLLLDLAKALARAARQPKPELNMAPLHEAGLRMFVLTTFIANWLMASVVPDLRDHYLEHLERLLQARNGFVRNCVEAMCARVDQNSPVKPNLKRANVRAVAEDWGYRSDRVSKMVWPRSNAV